MHLLQRGDIVVSKRTLTSFWLGSYNDGDSTDIVQVPYGSILIVIDAFMSSNGRRMCFSVMDIDGCVLSNGVQLDSLQNYLTLVQDHT